MVPPKTSSPTPPSAPDHDPRLASIRSGDLSVFDALYHEIVPALLRFAQRIAPPHFAEDAVQDVMLDLWERRETLVIQGSLRGYVFGAVRLRLADRLRHEMTATSVNDALLEATHPVIIGGNMTASPSAHAETRELELAVQEALATLPSKARTILILRWIEGLKYPEIASALGISVEAAKKQGRRMEVVIRDLLSRFAPDGNTGR